jgi:hypothetical protein
LLHQCFIVGEGIQAKGMWYYGNDGGAEQQGRGNNFGEGENMLGSKELWYSTQRHRTPKSYGFLCNIPILFGNLSFKKN